MCRGGVGEGVGEECRGGVSGKFREGVSGVSGRCVREVCRGGVSACVVDGMMLKCGRRAGGR